MKLLRLPSNHQRLQEVCARPRNCPEIVHFNLCTLLEIFPKCCNSFQSSVLAKEISSLLSACVIFIGATFKCKTILYISVHHTVFGCIYAWCVLHTLEKKSHSSRMSPRGGLEEGRHTHFLLGNKLWGWRKVEFLMDPRILLPGGKFFILFSAFHSHSFSIKHKWQVTFTVCGPFWIVAFLTHWHYFHLSAEITQHDAVRTQLKGFHATCISWIHVRNSV